MSHCFGIIALIAFIIIQDYTHCLRLVEVRIPNYVIKGSTAQLECLYDLDGDALYSIKWYKDGNEFYRYLPRDMPPAQTFLLPGVNVDLLNSTDSIVTLRDVSLQSAGRFRCEVSGEAPSFQTVTEHGDMIVVSLPDQGPPKITGGRPRYQIGDWVRINCTAGRSKPAVQLSWYVNGEPAEPHTTRKYETIVSGRDGLETAILGLQFRVEQQHFRNSDMKLKCVASLSTFYWRSNEESVEGDRPQKAPVLESRETVYASNSRADPVQASKSDSVVVGATHTPSLWLLLLPAIIIVSGCYERIQLYTTTPTQQQQTEQLYVQQQQQQQKCKQQNEQKLNTKHICNAKQMKRVRIVLGNDSNDYDYNHNYNNVDLNNNHNNSNNNKYNNSNYYRNQDEQVQNIKQHFNENISLSSSSTLSNVSATQTKRFSPTILLFARPTSSWSSSSSSTSSSAAVTLPLPTRLWSSPSRTFISDLIVASNAAAAAAATAVVAPNVVLSSKEQTVKSLAAR